MVDMNGVTERLVKYRILVVLGWGGGATCCGCWGGWGEDPVDTEDGGDKDDIFGCRPAEKPTGNEDPTDTFTYILLCQGYAI